MILLWGLNDIEKDTNRYGVCRCLTSIVLSYRTYPDVYDEIESGFIPDRKFDFNKGLEAAASGSEKHLIDYCISNGAIDFRSALYPVTYDANYTLVEFFINKCKELKKSYYNDDETPTEFLMECYSKFGNAHTFCEWEFCIYNAAYINDLKLVKYYMDNGADTIHYALFGAAAGGHIELIQYCLDNGPILIREAMKHAASESRREAIDFLIKIDNNIENINDALEMAILEKQFDIIDFLIDKGITYFDTALNASIRVNNLKLVKLFIQKGIIDIHNAVRNTYPKNKEIIKLIKDTYNITLRPYESTV